MDKLTSLTTAQDAQRDDAWRTVLNAMLSSGLTWAALPAEAKRVLGIHQSLGVCSGMLVTRVGASGLNEFIHRLNRRQFRAV